MLKIHYDIRYKPSFIRQFKKTNKDLQEEILETIELLKHSQNHQKIKVHKLSGKLKEFHSCSVNYRHRIVFMFEKDVIIILLEVGNHDVYQ